MLKIRNRNLATSVIRKIIKRGHGCYGVGDAVLALQRAHLVRRGFAQGKVLDFCWVITILFQRRSRNRRVECGEVVDATLGARKVYSDCIVKSIF